MRLIKWTLTLCIVSFTLTAFALLIGRSQPLSTALQRLHLTDCELPCFIGIMPGQTTLAQAKARILTVFGNSADYAVSYSVFQGDNLTVQIGDQLSRTNMAISFKSIRPESSSSIPDKIWLAIYRGNGREYTLRDLYPILHDPELVMSTDAYWTAMLYKGGKVRSYNIVRRCGSITLTDPIRFLWLYDRVPTPSLGDSDPIRWKGFNRCYDFFGRQ
jgi:hypothetical protein